MILWPGELIARGKKHAPKPRKGRSKGQRQQLDATNIRIISTAIPPIGRSWPPKTVVLGAAGGIAGMGLGVVLALSLGYLAAWRRNREGLA